MSLQPTLTLAYGGIWKVGLEKADEKIWFNDCWQEFMEYHSISSGHLLVFGYERNSNFHVLIFYPTFIEIQNPLSKNYKLENQVKIIGIVHWKMKKSSSIECLILQLTPYLLTNVSKTVVINEGYYSNSNDEHINPIGENVLPLD